MRQFIVISNALTEQIDTDTIKGSVNALPLNTVRYNVDKTEHIKSVLGIDDLSEYLSDESEITLPSYE
tara:strand:+ start:2267 stop:2470 length:204 start_codon:yes stop_codon:yes gene_type:complete